MRLCAQTVPEVSSLRVSGLTEPLGIDRTPTFSWTTTSEQRGFVQKAYEITVKDAQGTTVWNSGQVESELQTGIVYEGEALSSRSAYTWTVIVTGADGTVSAPAEGRFETAFMSPTEWTGQWITSVKAPNSVHEVVFDEPVSARYFRIYATKLGYPASMDNTGYYMQFAEVEIYGEDGKLEYTPKASSNMNYSTIWNLNYINDGHINNNAQLGYTTQKFTSSSQTVHVTFDLGETKTVTRMVLYPRQDDRADGHADRAANFPSNFTVRTSDNGISYSIKKRETGVYPEFQNNTNNVPYYGRNFTVDKEVKRARIYASGLGVFTMRLNGKPVTEDKLEPGESEYEKTVLYSTYDVTSLLSQGENILLAQVAGGIYNVEYLHDRFSKGEIKNSGTTGLLAELHIEYTDGTTQTVLTDGDWRTASSPTLGSNWWGGEDYDARKSIDNIYSADLDMSAWTNAKVFTPHFTSTQAKGFGTLRSRMYEPLRVVEEWKAVKVNTVQSGGYTLQVVDFGRNFAGQYKFRLKGKPGQTITLREGESLTPEGSVLMENFYTGPADTYETYTFRGDEQGEEWGPEFMYHGFRYLQIIGLDEAPDPEAFTAMRIRNNMDNSGTFTTSNKLINDIHVICRDAIASQLYNSLTDCPHREKLGWLEVPNLMFNSLVYNFDMQNFFRKVVLDAFDSQLADGRVPSTAPHYMSVYDNDPNWGGTAIFVPYRCWKTYADKTLMTEFYPQMKRLIDYYTTQTTNYIMNDISVLSDWGQETAGVQYMVPSQFTITTTYYYQLRIMAEMAKELGYADDAQGFNALADKVKVAFNEKYYGQYKQGEYGRGQQSELAMPLYYGLVDEANEQAVAKKLAERVAADNYKVKTGEVALKPLFMSLAKYGYNDIVWQMAKQTDCPSYGYWVVQGYTTTPEYWDVGLFSQNHCMMDHIEEWFFSQVGGIQNGGTGFKHLLIQPYIPSDLTQMRTTTRTNYGEVSVAYTRTDDNITYDIVVPANTTATIVLPLRSGDTVSEGGLPLEAGKNGVESVVIADDKATINVGSGHYVLTSLFPHEGGETAIENIPADPAHAPINVYALSGQMVRHAVAGEDATAGLHPGLYIVGDKKVLVR